MPTHTKSLLQLPVALLLRVRPTAATPAAEESYADWMDYTSRSNGSSDVVYLRDVNPQAPLTTRYTANSATGNFWTEWFTPGAAGAEAVLENIGSCSQQAECNDLYCQPGACVCGVSRPKSQVGAVLSAYEYRRFQPGTSPLWTPLRFSGQYHDAESDVVDNWHRTYDPATGSYLQPDPLLMESKTMKAQSKYGEIASVYTYAASNPLHYTDSTGLFIRKGECKNWDAALLLAREKAGCDSRGSGAPSCTCQLPCNICGYLTDGVLPHARIYPPGTMGGLRIHGATGPSIKWEGGVGVGFNEILCGNNKEYLAGIETLARAMVHEALHVCKFMAGIEVPATNDAWSRPLFNLGPDDAEDVTDKCFGGSN